MTAFFCLVNSYSMDQLLYMHFYTSACDLINWRRNVNKYDIRVIVTSPYDVIAIRLRTRHHDNEVNLTKSGKI